MKLTATYKEISKDMNIFVIKGEGYLRLEQISYPVQSVSTSMEAFPLSTFLDARGYHKDVR